MAFKGIGLASKLTASALAVSALAACGVPVIVPNSEGASNASNAAAAAELGGRQTPLIVYGTPFPGVDSRTLSAAVGQSVIHAAPPDVGTRIAPWPTGSSRPEYAVVMVFNPTGNFNPSNLCDDAVAVASDPARRPIKLEAALCGPAGITTSTGWLSTAQGPQDPEFQNLAFGVVRTLFPNNASGD